MPPTPPPPEPLEPPVDATALPADAYPYSGLFRSPSLLIYAGALNDRHRQDLPNPLVSTEPLFPPLEPEADPEADLSGWSSFPPSESSSRRSSQFDRYRDSSRSPPRSPRLAPTTSAFDDPTFRTIPPPPGTTFKPMPLPTVHIYAHHPTEDTVEYDTSSTYGGPHLKFVTSADLLPWHVTSDWRERQILLGDQHFSRRDLGMEGRGSKRRIKVWQRKEAAASSETRPHEDE